MAPKRRPSRKDLTRRGPTRESIPRILVVCEGAKTEPRYLRKFSSDEKNGSVTVEAVGLGKDPLSLVEEAIRIVNGLF